VGVHVVTPRPRSLKTGRTYWDNKQC